MRNGDGPLCPGGNDLDKERKIPRLVKRSQFVTILSEVDRCVCFMCLRGNRFP